MPSPMLKYLQGQRLTARQLNRLQGKPTNKKQLKPIEDTRRKEND